MRGQGWLHGDKGSKGPANLGRAASRRSRSRHECRPGLVEAHCPIEISAIDAIRELRHNVQWVLRWHGFTFVQEVMGKIRNERILTLSFAGKGSQCVGLPRRIKRGGTPPVRLRMRAPSC